jgi:hypothetical protein
LEAPWGAYHRFQGRATGSIVVYHRHICASARKKRTGPQIFCGFAAGSAVPGNSWGARYYSPLEGVDAGWSTGRSQEATILRRLRSRYPRRFLAQEVKCPGQHDTRIHPRAQIHRNIIVCASIAAFNRLRSREEIQWQRPSPLSLYNFCNLLAVASTNLEIIMDTLFVPAMGKGGIRANS